MRTPEELAGVTAAEVKRRRAKLVDQARHLANQLATDLEEIRAIKDRWSDGGRCQAGDLEDLFHARPVPDPEHAIYLVLSGIGVRQDSLETELRQALDVGDRLMFRLRAAAEAADR